MHIQNIYNDTNACVHKQACIYLLWWIENSTACWWYTWRTGVRNSEVTQGLGRRVCRWAWKVYPRVAIHGCFGRLKNLKKRKELDVSEVSAARKVAKTAIFSRLGHRGVSRSNKDRSMHTFCFKRFAARYQCRTGTCTSFNFLYYCLQVWIRWPHAHPTVATTHTHTKMTP